MTAQEELLTTLKRHDLVQRIGPLYLTLSDPKTDQLPLADLTISLQPDRHGAWSQSLQLPVIEVPSSLVDEPTWTFVACRQSSLATGQTRRDYAELNLPTRLFLHGAIYCKY